MSESKNSGRFGQFSRWSVRFILVLGAVGLFLELAIYFAINYESFTRKPMFQNVAKISGIGKIDHPTGSAWIDYDMDGDLDLIVGSQKGIIVYNKRGSVFVKIRPESIGISGGEFFVNGLAPADYDNDGCPDLYVAAASEYKITDRLYKNTCDGRFIDVTDEAGIDDPYMSFGVSWGDYDADGFLDIYVANYGKPISPLEYITHPNSLFRNNGDGTFSKVIGEAGATGIPECPNLQERKILGGELEGVIYKAGMEPKKRSYQPIWLDYDKDGHLDIFVATDTGVSPLYKNMGDGTFRDVTYEAGLCREASGMGVAIGDFNNDGWQDIYVTNTGANFLWINQADGTFLELAAQRGVANLVGLGWGVGAYDFNNDGWLDLYMANGVVGDKGMTLEEIKQSGLLGETTSFADFLYINRGGGLFEDLTGEYGFPGTEDLSESAAFADFDRNGFMDFYQQGSQLFPDQESFLWRNNGNGNSFLAVKLVGTMSNRDGIGAKITARTGKKSQYREITSGSSFLSGSELVAHFGFNDVKRIDSLEVIWPSGEVSELRDVPTRRRIVITEGDGGYKVEK